MVTASLRFAGEQLSIEIHVEMAAGLGTDLAAGD